MQEFAEVGDPAVFPRQIAVIHIGKRCKDEYAESCYS